ncbi:hypothetical protein B0H10DRAFT_1965007 [Mycena sp. CBHHK59/15]|nr:hypothetical protein B0H10DRAFT_1965007 [Mycena sp. CBHHK59/15]
MAKKLKSLSPRLSGIRNLPLSPTSRSTTGRASIKNSRNSTDKSKEDQDAAGQKQDVAPAGKLLQQGTKSDPPPQFKHLGQPDDSEAKLAMSQSPHYQAEWTLRKRNRSLTFQEVGCRPPPFHDFVKPDEDGADLPIPGVNTHTHTVWILPSQRESRALCKTEDGIFTTSLKKLLPPALGTSALPKTVVTSEGKPRMSFPKDKKYTYNISSRVLEKLKPLELAQSRKNTGEEKAVAVLTVFPEPTRTTKMKTTASMRIILSPRSALQRPSGFAIALSPRTESCLRLGYTLQSSCQEVGQRNIDLNSKVKAKFEKMKRAEWLAYLAEAKAAKRCVEEEQKKADTALKVAVGSIRQRNVTTNPTAALTLPAIRKKKDLKRKLKKIHTKKGIESEVEGDKEEHTKEKGKGKAR